MLCDYVYVCMSVVDGYNCVHEWYICVCMCVYYVYLCVCFMYVYVCESVLYACVCMCECNVGVRVQVPMSTQRKENGVICLYYSPS